MCVCVCAGTSTIKREKRRRRPKTNDGRARFPALLLHKCVRVCTCGKEVIARAGFDSACSIIDARCVRVYECIEELAWNDERVNAILRRVCI